MRNSQSAGLPAVDLAATDSFLSAIGPQASAFSFSTFDDKVRADGVKRRRRDLTHNLIHGPFAEIADRLQSLNARGAGIFVMFHEGDGSGRSNAHVKAIRGVYQDDDTGVARAYPLPPSLIVETSPGRFQRFWLCNGLSLEDYRVIERCLVREYGHDPNATGLSRVVRLPGFLHRKRTPHLVGLIGGTGTVYDRSDLLAAFPSPSPDAKCKTAPAGDAPRQATSPAAGPGWQEIEAALAYISADDRHTWCKVGMALHDYTQGGEDGFSVWDRWSQTAPDKYVPDEQLRTWQSFRGTGLTLVSLFALAREHGADLSELARTFRSANAGPAQPVRMPRTTSRFAHFVQRSRAGSRSSGGDV